MATLGGITIGISIMGCFGMALRNKMNSIVFFSVNLTIMFVEIVLGCYWWYGNKQFMQFPELLNWFLQDDVNTGEDWATLQIKVNIQCMSFGLPFTHISNYSTIAPPVQLLWSK